MTNKMSINKADTRVLLVDDNVDDRELFMLVLERLGYSKIATALDGPNALTLARDYQPNLVLMDTQMPGPKGYDVCGQMRQTDYGKNAAIGGMSYSDDPQHSDLWIKNGADFYFGKSLIGSNKGQKDLDARIQEALAKHHMQQIVEKADI